MARAKRVVQEVTRTFEESPRDEPETVEVPPSPSEVAEIDAEQSADAELADVLSSLAGTSGTNITVYRMGSNKQQEYMFVCEPAAFSLDELRDKYGGGNFRLYITKNRQLYRNITLSVAKPFSPPAVVAPQFDVVAIMKQQMDDSRAMYSEIIKAISGRESQSSFDPASMMTAMLTGMATLQNLTKPVEQKPAVSELLGLIEVIERIKGDGDSREPGMIDLAKEFLRSPLLSAIGQQVQAGQQPRAVAPVNPNPQLAQPTPAAPPENQGDAMFKKYLSQLCFKASQDADPELYADLVVDNVPAIVLENVLKHPDPVMFLAAQCPEVATFRVWFEAMISAIRDRLAEDAQDDEGADHPIPGASDPAS